MILGTAIDSSPSMAFVRKINVSTKVFLRRLPGVKEARRGREGTGGMGDTGETEERGGVSVKKRMGRMARDRGKGAMDREGRGSM